MRAFLFAIALLRWTHPEAFLFRFFSCIFHAYFSLKIENLLFFLSHTYSIGDACRIKPSKILLQSYNMQQKIAKVLGIFRVFAHNILFLGILLYSALLAFQHHQRDQVMAGSLAKKNPSQCFYKLCANTMTLLTKKGNMRIKSMAYINWSGMLTVRLKSSLVFAV